MAREKKPIELKPVEEDPIRVEEIVRLERDTTVVKVVHERVVVRPAAEARLEVPDLSGAEARRTHEPGVEVLMEGEGAVAFSEETVWGGEDIARRPLPWGWFALLGLVLLGAVAWSVTRLIGAKEGMTEVKDLAESKITESEATDREIEESLKYLDQAVKGFCNAKSVAEMVRWVRHPERVRPLMERHYAAHPLRPPGYVRQKDFQGAMLGTANNFWVVKVVTADGKTKPLLVEQEGDRDYRVDWETAVTYQPMDWDEYALDRPKGTTLDFRVHVAEDHFFSHEFADAERWASFRLTAPGAAETLWGYAAKGSEAEMILKQALANHQDPRKPLAVILRLGLPEGLNSRRGVIIEQVLSTRWIFVESPEDAR